MFELVLPNWLDAWLVLVGIALAYVISRLDDRSIAAVVLFVFAPVMVMRFGMSQFLPAATEATQTDASYQFMFILFFLIFHTGALVVIATQFFALLKVTRSMRHLYVMHCVIISGYALRNLQPLWGDDVAASVAVSALIFLHLGIAFLLGIYFGVDEPSFSGKVMGLLKSPFPYALGLGLGLAVVPVEVPYTLLEQFNVLTQIVVPAGLVLTGVVWGRYIHLVEWAEYTALLNMVGWCVLFQLLLSPALAIAIVPFMQLESIALEHTLILSCGAPVGIYALLITAFYRTANERRFSVLCIAMTSVLSLITLPILQQIVLLLFPLVTD